METKNIIDIICSYLNSLEFIPYTVLVDFLDDSKDSMSVSPLQGGEKSYDILGNYTDDFQFQVNIGLKTPSIVESSNAIGILNSLGQYFEEATKNKKLLPDLGEGRETEQLKIISRPALWRRDDKGNEIFQCSYVLRYYQSTNN
jgi:hypothetical protein